jgi:anti-sigma regulatory factor (Ser/Thr protein kinase)
MRETLRCGSRLRWGIQGTEVAVDDDTDPPAPAVTFEFGHDIDAPRRARQALRRLFPQPDRLAEDVAVVASELVTNVIRHTDDGGQLQAWDDDALRLEVHDTNPTLPSTPDYGDERGGHGLRIVNDLADDWGARVDGIGKTLWAEFHRLANEQTPRSSRDMKPAADTGELQQPHDRPINDDARKVDTAAGCDPSAK